MDGLMTVCLDARKGRTIGSHWPNHVRASGPLDHLPIANPELDGALGNDRLAFLADFRLGVGRG